jgi:hypothetical protein
MAAPGILNPNSLSAASDTSVSPTLKGEVATQAALAQENLTNEFLRALFSSPKATSPLDARAGNIALASANFDDSLDVSADNLYNSPATLIATTDETAQWLDFLAGNLYGTDTNSLKAGENILGQEIASDREQASLATSKGNLRLAQRLADVANEGEQASAHARYAEEKKVDQ